jgi:hypothetical protein
LPIDATSMSDQEVSDRTPLFEFGDEVVNYATLVRTRDTVRAGEVLFAGSGVNFSDLGDRSAYKLVAELLARMYIYEGVDAVRAYAKSHTPFPHEIANFARSHPRGSVAAWQLNLTGLITGLIDRIDRGEVPRWYPADMPLPDDAVALALLISATPTRPARAIRLSPDISTHDLTGAVNGYATSVREAADFLAPSGTDPLRRAWVEREVSTRAVGGRWSRAVWPTD